MGSLPLTLATPPPPPLPGPVSGHPPACPALASTPGAGPAGGLQRLPWGGGTGVRASGSQGGPPSRLGTRPASKWSAVTGAQAAAPARPPRALARAEPSGGLQIDLVSGRPAGWPGLGTARSPSDLPGCDQPRHPWALWRDRQRPGRGPHGATPCSSGALRSGVSGPPKTGAHHLGGYCHGPWCPSARTPVGSQCVTQRTERGLGQGPPSPGPEQVGRPSSPPPPAAPRPPGPHRRQQQGSFRGFIDHQGRLPGGGVRPA